MAVNANAEYVPLMAIEEHENNDIDAEGNIRHDGYKHGMSQNQRVGFSIISSITIVSVYSALAISLVAFFLSSLSFWSFGRPSASSLEIGPQALRRPSLYLGLERVTEIKVRLDAEALLRPAPDHSGSDGHGHGGMHDSAGTPEVDGMVKPSAFVRLNRLYPDMNWTDEKIVLSEADLMILYFPLPSDAISNPSQCTLRASFPAQAALDGRLLTVEGRSPSITLSQVTLPETFHGSALGELTWNRRPQTQLVLGTVPATFGSMNSSSMRWECPRDRAIIEMQLRCENDDLVSGEGCRVEFKGSDISDTFGIALLVD